MIPCTDLRGYCVGTGDPSLKKCQILVFRMRAFLQNGPDPTQTAICYGQTCGDYRILEAEKEKHGDGEIYGKRRGFLPILAPKNGVFVANARVFARAYFEC